MPAYEYDPILDDITTNTIGDGSLCKECCNNNLCNDKQCPLYEYRKESNE